MEAGNHVPGILGASGINAGSFSKKEERPYCRQKEMKWVSALIPRRHAQNRKKVNLKKAI